MKTKTINSTMIYYPGGRINNDAAEDFLAALLWFLDRHKDCDLIINMEDVTSIGSKGIRALLTVVQKMKNLNRKFSICCPGGLVMRIIDIFNIHRIIEVYQSETDAVNDMERVSVTA